MAWKALEKINWIFPFGGPRIQGVCEWATRKTNDERKATEWEWVDVCVSFQAFPPNPIVEGARRRRTYGVVDYCGVITRRGKTRLRSLFSSIRLKAYQRLLETGCPNKFWMEYRAKACSFKAYAFKAYAFKACTLRRAFLRRALKVNTVTLKNCSHFQRTCALHKCNYKNRLQQKKA